MQNKYMKPRGTRNVFRALGGRFKGGKLAPVGAQIFRESESGVVSQTVTYELDPLAGRLITDVSADVVCVYVPALACDALKNPLDDYPGNGEIFRQKLLAGTPVFGLEAEGEISKRCGINPRSIDGVKSVNEVIRLAHNAAINHLRTRKYVSATKLLAGNTAMTPALVAQTVLDRLNAVLDPEDRVNGRVDFNGDVTLTGNGDLVNLFMEGTAASNTIDDLAGTTQGAVINSKLAVKRDGSNDPANPMPYVSLANVIAAMTTSGISLSDFYNAEKMDRLTREMRQLVDTHPEYGEELINRFAHGLNIDPGKQPFVVYQKTAVFGKSLRTAMDGASLDVQQTDMIAQHSFTVPIPANEFGGVLITFASVRPDEALASQPDPLGSDVWAARNYVADEMAIDPVPVTIRDLYADCLQADENTISCYIGNNHLHKTYVHYGFNRHLNPLDVENKSAIWQLEVPMSVTPESVIYPETLSHYPFDDATAEVCTYGFQSTAIIQTPMIFGPTPIEELAEIETADVFEDAPA